MSNSILRYVISIMWKRSMQVLPSPGLIASFRLCLTFKTAAVTCEKWYEADRKYAGNIWRAARAPTCLSCSHRQLGVQAALQHHYNMHVRLLAHRVGISVCWKPNRLHSFQWYSSGKELFTFISKQLLYHIYFTGCFEHILLDSFYLYHTKCLLEEDWVWSGTSWIGQNTRSPWEKIP